MGSRKLITDQQRDECARRYTEGESSDKIAESMGISRPSVLRSLRKKGITVRKPGRPMMTKEQEEECCRMYSLGESTISIASHVGFTHSCVGNVLRSNGVKIRSLSERKRRLQINDHALDDLSDPNVAYWIGFLVGDGCVYKNTIQLRLSSKDRFHLEKFKNFISSEHKITDYIQKSGYKPGSNVSSFSFTSEIMISRLLDLGIGERKTFSCKPPELLDKNPHFWRGLVDADGWVSTNRVGIGLCGNIHIVEGFRSFCKSIISTNRNLHPNNSIFSFHLGENKGLPIITALYDNIYEALDRKKTNAVRFINLGNVPQP